MTVEEIETLAFALADKYALAAVHAHCGTVEQDGQSWMDLRALGTLGSYELCREIDYLRARGVLAASPSNANLVREK